ncbi:MAG: hypothetical protein JNK51_01870 [Blastocatellia bacterium]|nr:hypothetical protein [Chloracidobacterium sp.]MBL8183645.1 hypothetical protein [Blastocatellia bacterium]HRK52194.1 hypothetical protein [Pyrinomonadaceae bacterium]
MTISRNFYQLLTKRRRAIPAGEEGPGRTRERKSALMNDAAVQQPGQAAAYSRSFNISTRDGMDSM